ncbi:MAG: DNA/RNA nuclease SfsA [Promethearchaeota archaeon]
MVRIAHKLEKAIFIERENRFVGIVDLNGKEVKVHILNPGRMIKFLIPGAKILIEDRNSPKRKLQYSLLYVVIPNSLILIDSIVSNKIVKEALINRTIPEFKEVIKIEPEKRYGRKNHSRIDFLLNNSIYIEVKSTNYTFQRIGYFPDAPSKRASKHVEELIDVLENSSQKQAYIIFLAQRTDIEKIRPFDEIDPEFGKILRIGAKKGIKLMGFQILFTKNGLFASLGEQIPVELNYPE